MVATIFFGLAAAAAAGLLLAVARNRWLDFQYERSITAEDPTAVLLGTDELGRRVFLKQKFRTMHAQIIGTTSAGKTESLVLPWAIKDIENGSGCLIIDGKSDRAFLDKLRGYVVQAGREKDFRLCSLAYPMESATFNPLIGGTAQEVAERVFSSFTIENEYYRSVQFKAFTQILLLLEALGERPTMTRIYQLISSQTKLAEAMKGLKDEAVVSRVAYLGEMEPSELRQVLSGLDATLSHFTAPSVRRIFDAEFPDITLDGAMAGSQIIYFQLPSMYLPMLASMTGKLVLQCLQSAIAKRHLALAGGDQGFFSVFLDDFQDYVRRVDAAA